MCEGNISQEFRYGKKYGRNMEETKSCFIKKINKTELMSKKHKKVFTTLNYIQHFTILMFQFLLLIL